MIIKFYRQRFIRVNGGDSFSVRCPSEEESAVAWEFYPYASTTGRQSINGHAGPFSNDGDIEFLSFNDTRNIFVARWGI